MTIKYLKNYLQECKLRSKKANLLELYFKYTVDKEMY